jgi:cell division protein FtsB
MMTTNAANRIVWGVAAALGLAGLALFSWNLNETIALKTTVSAEFAKLNAKLDAQARDYERLDRRVEKLELKK